ncbi:MAG: hypothetical protein QRY16_14200 [Enterobacterales bacterium endosymbiont of Blomia tropicalis]|uniref:hypothetical protein n=1 Tax=Mixta mediterraneensis TaxID=2758443 RepID=UPI0025A6C9EA|nr:hypothetical protein [Mixta mediterraneensis]MDL4914894.1 hypothetical protein [Mixta mediterraneensis]
MNRQVNHLLMPGVLCATLLLAGCAGAGLGEWNQKISDAAHSLAGRSGSGSGDGGMPWMTRAGNTGPRQDVRHTYTLPVDVDTAAARLKSHYQFISSDELESLRWRDQHGDWSASAIDEARPVWSANKGSYYRMGQEWKGNDRLELEVVKSGAGSRLKVTYSSPEAPHLTDTYLGRLMTQLQQVAKGQIRPEAD